MRNKKAQVGPIGAILLFIIFILNWFIWLGSWLSEIGKSTVQNNNMYGVEAFFYSNLNLAVLVIMVLGMLGYMYFAGANE